MSAARRFDGSFGIFAAGDAVDRVSRDTGFSDHIMGMLWDKYGCFMPDPPRGAPIKAQAYFYMCGLARLSCARGTPTRSERDLTPPPPRISLAGHCLLLRLLLLLLLLLLGVSSSSSTVQGRARSNRICGRRRRGSFPRQRFLARSSRDFSSSARSWTRSTGLTGWTR